MQIIKKFKNLDTMIKDIVSLEKPINFNLLFYFIIKIYLNKSPFQINSFFEKLLLY